MSARQKKVSRIEKLYRNDETFRVPVDRIIDEVEAQKDEIDILQTLEDAIYIVRFFLENPKRLNYLKNH